MGNIPLSNRRSEEEEEARLFFVGMTRAKNYLEISYLAKISLPGATPYPSTYISMLPPALVVKEDEESAKSLDELMKMLREEKELKKEAEMVKTAKHPKYGTGKILFEDENIIRVEFQGYGEKEFSKMFCPLIL
jgi:ATP-dependent exoDNAse (exonuclease V) beta subunit